MKNIIFAALVIVATLSACDKTANDPVVQQNDSIQLSIVDKNATTETKAHFTHNYGKSRKKGLCLAITMI